ncbi:MAG TPA: hypothetical protein VGI26_01970 [Solirubrobacteraceae bacterium]|jgi:hypothetical protein
MRKIHIVGLALVAMFAFFAVSVASASAVEWLIKNEAIAAATAVKSKSVGKLVLEDMGMSKIECEGTDAGTVGPGAVDSITAITATGCVAVSGSCEAPVTAKAVGLPWATELVAGPRDKITTVAAGWAVECLVAGIFKIQDTCTGATSTGISNVAAGVDAAFDATSGETPATCTLTGKATGLVEGTDLNENPAGGQLTVG